MSLLHALSIRSDFSIGESSLQVKKIVQQAKELGYESVAVVDTMSVSAMPDLTSAANEAEIKPILGCTLRVYDDPKWRKPKAGEPGALTNPMHTLKVYVHTEDGLRQLYQLLSLANDAEHYYYNSRVGMEEVCSILRAPDVSITTGDFWCLMSHPEYLTRAAQLQGCFRHHFWVELVPVNTPLFDTLNLRAQEVVDALGCRALATYPALYPTGGADSADVLRAITSNNQMTDPWLQIPYIRDFELAEPTRLIDRAKLVTTRGDVDAAFVRAAIRGTGEFAAQDFYRFEKKAPCLPTMAVDEFRSLVLECKAGWTRRFERPVLGHAPDMSDPVVLTGYSDRLKYELGVIKKMGFSGYFLLVQEIVRWSKGAGIVVGPGRGSVGGSLIAYLMGITDVDPIRFGLLFERFINPERVDLPDADLDFMSTRRQEVIEHIEQTYGKENVAGISNYSTLGAASAMRDVSRVHGLEMFEYAASKQVEKEHGVSQSLEDSAASVPDIAKFRDKYPNVWRHATALEGSMRALGRHAAGVVVAGEPVMRRAVVETRSGGQVVNWDKRTVEDHGLIKMDILGLSTLDTLALAVDYIKARHGVTVDLLTLPLDDQNTLDAFARGDTVGVFQFESLGMRKLLTQLGDAGELSFDDLAATTALFRPGPLDAGMCEEYVQIKAGHRGVHYPHPSAEAALKGTYGLMVYQEQIQRICHDLSGFSLAQADGVRKAIGKKDREKMKSFEDNFVSGAELGYAEVELEDGTKKLVHRARKLRVKESADLFTIEEVLAKGLTLLDTLA